MIHREIANLVSHLKSTVKSSRHRCFPIYTTYRIVEKAIQVKVVYKNERD